MPHIKPVLVICWIALAWVAALVGPLDFLTAHHASEGFSAVAAPMLNPEEAPAGTERSSTVLARRLGSRTVQSIPIARVESGLPSAPLGHAAPSIDPQKPGGFIAYFLQSWQFSRRMAPAPRAPARFA